VVRKMRFENLKSATRLVSFLLVWGTAALLSPPANAEEEEGWSFGLSGYAWLAGMEGEVATLPGAPPAEVDITVGDVLENLDIGLMALGEARKGRFGLLGEIFYVDVSTDGATPGPLFSTADFEQSVLGLTVGGFYRLVARDDASVDLVAGFRLWSVDTKLRLGAGVLPARTLDQDESWVDPIAGVKGRVGLGSSWYASGWAVAAIAGESDSAWDLFGGVGYRFNPKHSVTVGYRHQSVDFRDGSFRFDVELSGPAAAYVYRF